MKKLIVGLVAALIAANSLLVVAATVGTISVVIVLARLTGLLN